MSVGRIGILFLVLILVSILGRAAEVAPNKTSTAKNGLHRNPANAATAVKEGATKEAVNKDADAAKGTNVKPVSSTSPVEENKNADTDVVEEARSNNIKGVKKRGAAENASKEAGSKEASSKDSSANLFEDEKGFLAGLDYPELQVVPRASERLQMEAQEEKSSFIGNYWPVQVSAIALILAGSSSSGKYKQLEPTENQKKENQFASQMGLLIGSMWLGGTFYLSHSLSYSSAYPEIKKITGKDKKSQLMRERLAEEAMERPAKIAATINTLSVWTNFLLSMYIYSHSKPSLPNYAGFAMGLSFLPLLIDNRIVQNWEKHQEYKRKIYAPITRVDFTIDPHTQKLTPLLGMQWTF